MDENVNLDWLYLVIIVILAAIAVAGWNRPGVARESSRAGRSSKRRAVPREQERALFLDLLKGVEQALAAFVPSPLVSFNIVEMRLDKRQFAVSANLATGKRRMVYCRLLANPEPRCKVSADSGYRALATIAVASLEENAPQITAVVVRALCAKVSNNGTSIATT